MQQRVEAEGRTLKHAIETACELLSVSLPDLEYRLDTDHFRGGAETVKIQAWRKNGKEQETSQDARGLVLGILDRMGIKAQVEIEHGDDSIRVILVTEDPSLVIGQGGQTLEALQHLVNKALVRSRDDKRVVIDLENYREKREHSLRFLAQKICEKVLNERCTITLKPMNAYDRRLVHMEVARYPGLGSRSLGEGQVKRLQIFLDEASEGKRRQQSNRSTDPAGSGRES